MRTLAWLCVLAVLFTVAVPAAAPAAIVPPVAGLLDAPSAVTIVRIRHGSTPPDHTRAADVPARAPPLA